MFHRGDERGIIGLTTGEGPLLLLTLAAGVERTLFWLKPCIFPCSEVLGPTLEQIGTRFSNNKTLKNLKKS